MTIRESIARDNARRMLAWTINRTQVRRRRTWWDRLVAWWEGK